MKKWLSKEKAGFVGGEFSLFNFFRTSFEWLLYSVPEKILFYREINYNTYWSRLCKSFEHFFCENRMCHACQIVWLRTEWYKVKIYKYKLHIISSKYWSQGEDAWCYDWLIDLRDNCPCEVIVWQDTYIIIIKMCWRQRFDFILTVV